MIFVDSSSDIVGLEVSEIVHLFSTVSVDMCLKICE